MTKCYKLVPLLCALLILTLTVSCGGDRAENTTSEPETGVTETVTEGETTVSDTTSEPVQEGKDMIKGKIVLSAFWPPMKGFTDEEQYKYLADAQMDLLEYNSDPLFYNPTTLSTAIEMCDKYGLKLTLFDKSVKDEWLGMSDAAILKIVNKYKDYESVVGFYLKDEPTNANAWGHVAQVINSAFPGAICQLNMLPAGALEDARGHAEDLINAFGAENLRYLSFDQYPFGAAADSRPGMFGNFELVRSIGLKYGVDTACYIQAISNYSFRDTDEGEIRYHTSAALAYGFKNLKYFTWMTPVERSENFTDAIIDRNGQPTEKYTAVCSINASIKKVSDILGVCDAVQIYHTTSQDASTTVIPEDYFIRPSRNSGYDCIVSLMTDRNNGDEYVMIVNKNFNKDMTLTFDITGVTALYDVTEGNEQEVVLSEGNFTGDYKAGGFRLYKLGKGSDKAPEYTDDDASNLAKGKPVYSSSSKGEGGWYNYLAVDGRRKSGSSGYGYKCAEYYEESENYYLIDLKRSVTANRVDVYPAGSGASIGSFFPKAYEVYVSADGESYKKVAQFERDGELTEVPSHTFDAVQCRYVKLVFTSAASLAGQKSVEIAEIEVYNDDGTVAKPAELVREQPVLTGNLALNKPVTVSSDVNAWGWCAACATDGNYGDDNNPGWSSAVKTHMNDPQGEEWIIIDLETVTQLNEVRLYPRANGSYFPNKLEVQISQDGESFTTVYTYEDSPDYGVGDVRTLSFDTVSARYVRILSLEMTQVATSVDGYLFQLGEVEMYNK